MLYSPDPVLPVIQKGGTPANYSANAASVPISGYVLVATVPATAGRAAVEVQNQSAATIQLVRDDGSATAGTVSSILLSAGIGPGEPGDSWSSVTFKGRILVYAPSGSQVSAYQE